MARAPRAPWKRPNPRKRAGKASTHLSSTEKAAAKARARRAGRPYPNLVDNMRMASKKKSSKNSTGKKASKTRVGRKRAAYRKTAKKPAPKRSRQAAEKTRAAA